MRNYAPRAAPRVTLKTLKVTQREPQLCWRHHGSWHPSSAASNDDATATLEPCLCLWTADDTRPQESRCHPKTTTRSTIAERIWAGNAGSVHTSVCSRGQVRLPRFRWHHLHLAPVPKQKLKLVGNGQVVNNYLLHMLEQLICHVMTNRPPLHTAEKKTIFVSVPLKAVHLCIWRTCSGNFLCSLAFESYFIH